MDEGYRKNILFAVESVYGLEQHQERQVVLYSQRREIIPERPPWPLRVDPRCVPTSTVDGMRPHPEEERAEGLGNPGHPLPWHAASSTNPALQIRLRTGGDGP